MLYLKSKYGENCLTQSNNSTVLELYEFLLDHENWDTDFWWMGGGDGEIISILEQYFTDFDWKALEKDIQNWSSHQIEIFLYSIMSINSYNFEEDKIYQDNPKLIAEITKSVPQRANLILPILRIGIERGINHNEIFSIVIEEFFFFVNHFDILMKTDNNYLKLIDQIMDIIDDKNNLFNRYPKFKEKYEKAHQ